jgi:hypothetical protein
VAKTVMAFAVTLGLKKITPSPDASNGAAEKNDVLADETHAKSVDTGGNE